MHFAPINNTTLRVESSLRRMGLSLCILDTKICTEIEFYNLGHTYFDFFHHTKTIHVVSEIIAPRKTMVTTPVTMGAVEI